MCNYERMFEMSNLICKMALSVEKDWNDKNLSIKMRNEIIRFALANPIQNTAGFKELYSGNVSKKAYKKLVNGNGEYGMSDLSKNHDVTRKECIEDLFDILIPLFKKDFDILYQSFYYLIMSYYGKWSYTLKEENNKNVKPQSLKYIHIPDRKKLYKKNFK